MALAFAMLTSAPSNAQIPAPPPAYAEADTADIQAVIHRYFTAFTAKDYGKFGEFFQAPFVAFGRELVVLPTFEEVLKSCQGIRDPLDTADYSASKAVEIRVTPQLPFRALAAMHWQRFKTAPFSMKAQRSC